MLQENMVERERINGALTAAQERFDILFQRAPVMMHAVDKNQRIVKVNRRWLETLEYEKDEVLGREPTKFLTEESRARAVEDVLPLFWRAGSDRSVAFQFVRKDGRVLDALVDAEVCPITKCDFAAYAVIREAHNPMERERASTTLKRLNEITDMQVRMQGLLEDGQEIFTEVFHGLARLPREMVSGESTSSYLAIEMEVAMEKEVITNLAFNACPQLCVNLLTTAMLGKHPVDGVAAAKLAMEERYHGAGKGAVIAALQNTLQEYVRSRATLRTRAI